MIKINWKKTKILMMSQKHLLTMHLFIYLIVPKMFWQQWASVQFTIA